MSHPHQQNPTHSFQPARSDTAERVWAGLKKRRRADLRFRWFGRLATAFGLLCLAFLLFEILSKASGAFWSTHIELDIFFDNNQLAITNDTPKTEYGRADWQSLIKKAISLEFPQVNQRRQKRELYQLVSEASGFDLLDLAREQQDWQDWIGTHQRLWILANDDVDLYVKQIESDQPYTGRLTKQQQTWVRALYEREAVKLRFNSHFFSRADSREPEQAGILGALIGSFLVLSVTFALSFPVGVAAAIYLEEFAPENRFTEVIEININNLAAVPSIIFGLLGLAIFINFFGVPRSGVLVGGLVLSLMTLPTIIISSRAALRAVPVSIREAAIGLGASKQQAVFHHVLPLAMPGMLTGAIIGMAQALGETAPLLMIGMVAFVADVPSGLADPVTALPVQIFLWAESAERAFVEKTAAAILVLLGFMIAMNLIAVVLRKRLDKRW